jgi:hypothetical protein
MARQSGHSMIVPGIALGRYQKSFSGSIEFSVQKSPDINE